MMNRDNTPVTRDPAFRDDAPARSLRETLGSVRSSGHAPRAPRFQFRCLKRLCLPPRNLSRPLASGA